MATDGEGAQPVQQTAPVAPAANGKNGAAGAKAPETPGDGAKAFLQASVKWPHETGDPNVSLAFLLGWRMWRAVEWSDTADEHETPGIKAPKARFEVLSGQIDAAFAALTSGATPTPVPTFAAKYGAEHLTDRETARDDILAGLYKKDASLGKAAYLGARLHAFCWPGGTGPQVAIGSTDELKRLLVALATKLPPNAAHSVLNSLTLWEDRRARRQPVERDRLQRQGRIWRSFLAGETAAKDVLHVSDYIGTADQLVRRVRELFRRSFTGGLAVLWIVVGILAVAGVLVIALVHNKQGLVTGASSLIAAFGLTWKGIGQFFGNAVARSEQALWDSELDWAIAYRSTVCEEVRENLDKLRGSRRKDHYTVYQDWARKWPDMEIDDDPAPPAAPTGG